MAKRAFIIHGWDGTPEHGWYLWLKSELETNGFEAYCPQMPDTATPKIETWVPFISQLIGQPDENTYLIGHSIGCQTIIHYLNTLPENAKFGGVLFIAGYVENNIDLSEDTIEDQNLYQTWAQTPINFEKVKSHLNKSVAIFSDNDYYVLLDNAKIFEERFGSKTIVLHNMGHFTEDDGIKELPEALSAVLEMSQ